MWVAPIRSGQGEQKKGDFESSMSDWYNFVDDTQKSYGVDMGVLSKPFAEEQKKYYLQVISMFSLKNHFYRQFQLLMLFMRMQIWLFIYLHIISPGARFFRVIYSM